MNNNNYNWKSWRIGLLLVAVTSLITAGAGLTDPQMGWRGFVAVFCASMLTSLPLYLYKHPVPGLIDATGGGDAQISPAVKNETTTNKN